MAFVEIDPFRSAFVHVYDFRVIEPEQSKNRGVEIVDMYLVFDRV